MHCVRLLTTAEDILENHTINVRVKDPEYFLSIRQGKVSLEELIETSREKIEKLKEKFKESDLPDMVDKDLVRNVLTDIRKESLKLF